MASSEEIASKQFETWGLETSIKTGTSGLAGETTETSIEPGHIVTNSFSGKKKGLLIVTTFCNKDIPLLKKRIDWLNHISFRTERDLLLVGDSDVTDFELEEMATTHRPFFGSITVRHIIDSGPTHWPYNVNRAFRTTYRILTGYYGERFSWGPYNAWFNFESDVTLLKKDSIRQLEDVCRKSGKGFVGHVSETRMSDGSIVRHMNGAGVYPCQQMQGQIHNYTQNLLLAEGLPYDVAGLTAIGSIHSMPIGQYVHAFGTTEYTRDGDMIQGKQTLMNGHTSQYIFKLGEQIIHHGCKDASLVDVLMRKIVEAPKELPLIPIIHSHKKTDEIKEEVIKEEIVPVDVVNKKDRRRNVMSLPKADLIKIKEQILSDKAQGMKFHQLLQKHGLHPAHYKAILK